MARSEPPVRPEQINFPGFDITADDTVVDVGCGDGPVCVYAGHQGAAVIGIDIEPELIERANAAMAGVPARSFRGVVGDADPIDLPDRVASVVVCTEVLEHVDDPARVLGELFRIGRPGARYLISVPDPASEAIMRELAPAWYFQKPIHVRVFEHDVLDRVCRDAGLEISARHASGSYFSLYWTLRMAIGMEHKFAAAPAHPAFEQLDGVFATLLSHPNGPQALRTLDRILPKSQVVVARKPGGRSLRVDGADSSRRGPIGRAVVGALRDGSIDLAGLNLRWSVRRSPATK